MLTFRFTGADGCMVEQETLTSGMVGKEVKLEFTSDWNDLIKTAVFMAGAVTRDVVGVSDVVTIPAEVLAVPLERLYVGVYGVSGDGRVTPTIRALGPIIEPGIDPSGDEGTDPELDVWEQILVKMGDLEDLDTEAKDNLVEAINEALEARDCVKSINGVGPDENGEVTLSGYVKSINGIKPNSAGELLLDWVAQKTMLPLMILEETSLSEGFTGAVYYEELEGQDEVVVTYDDRLFLCVPEFGYSEGDGYYVYLGNKSLFYSSLADTGEPFLFWGYKNGVSLIAVFEDDGTHTVTITGSVYTYDKMPEEYLPESMKSVVLLDHTTGTKYKLYVNNGKLTMEEV